MLMTPIALQGSFTVLVGGTRGPADETKFRNPYGTGMFVDEIRFRADRNNDANWFELLTDLKLGRMPITNGFVPITCLGPIRNYEQDIESHSTDVSSSHNQMVVWRLPKPLYVPPGEFIAPKIEFRNMTGWAMGGGATSTTYVTLMGRALQPGATPPRTLDVPWAAAYVGPYRTTTADFLSTSLESELANPFDEHLNVQRFIGRNSSEAAFSNWGVPCNAISVQMMDGDGNIVLRDKTPFALAFPMVDRMWNVNARLRPHGFYILDIEEKYSVITAGSLTTQTSVAMIGYRTVPLRK